MVALKAIKLKLERTRFKQKLEFRIARSGVNLKLPHLSFDRCKTPAQLERAFFTSNLLYFIIAFLPVAISQTL